MLSGLNSVLKTLEQKQHSFTFFKQTENIQK